MSVRAKFKCIVCENQDPAHPDDGKNIKLEAVVGGGAENDAFFRWTPSGLISFECVNAAANKQFVVGQVYYVDFTPV